MLGEKQEYNDDHARPFARGRRRDPRHRSRSAQENARNSLVHYEEGLVESGGREGGCPARRGALGSSQKLPGECRSQQQKQQQLDSARHPLHGVGGIEAAAVPVLIFLERPRFAGLHCRYEVLLLLLLHSCQCHVSSTAAAVQFQCER